MLVCICIYDMHWIVLNLIAMYIEPYSHVYRCAAMHMQHYARNVQDYNKLYKLKELFRDISTLLEI